MIHARPDYARIQDPAGKIGEDEPVMLFRAQDRHMAAVLSHYAQLLADDPKAEPAIQHRVLDHIERVLEWQAEHGAKTPDLPQEPGHD